MLLTVSLLIPCFNSAPYLPRLFAGIRAQRVPFDEIICYDDCSTDDTIEVAGSLGATVIRGSRRRGAAYARNRLLDAASCEWVHFHDSDDLIDPDFLGFMLEKATTPKTVVVCNHRTTLDEDEQGQIIDHTAITREDPVRYLLSNLHFIHVNTVLFPRAVLVQLGGLDHRLRPCCDDVNIMLRAIHHGCPIAHVNRVLATFVRHDHSAMHTAKQYLVWRCFLLHYIRCFRFLDQRYRRQIGENAVVLGSYFFLHGFQRSAAQCWSLGRRCGVLGFGSPGSLEWRVSRLFGFRNFFYFRKWYGEARVRWAKLRAD